MRAHACREVRFIRSTISFFRKWGCALAGISLLTGCGPAAQSSNPSTSKDAVAERPLLKVGFQLDWYPAPEHGGHFQALLKNDYRDAGLDVTILPGGPGAYPFQKVATGQAQLAMGRADDVIMAIKQGMPLLIVGVQMQHDPQAILVHEESPVRSFKDLDGKTLMAGVGANWVAFLQHRYDIKFNVMPLDFGLARFIADKDFIQQCFISNEPYHVELQGVKTRALLIADGGYDPYRVIFTSQRFAREHPEAVKGFVAASIRGWTEFIDGDNSQARARIQKENPAQSPPLIDYSIATMKQYKLVAGDPEKGERVGQLKPERMSALIQELVDLKVLDEPMPLEKCVSFAFLPPELTPAKP
jgi:NitT/TauT family transport system substrate-binding protein